MLTRECFGNTGVLTSQGEHLLRRRGKSDQASTKLDPVSRSPTGKRRRLPLISLMGLVGIPAYTCIDLIPRLLVADGKPPSPFRPFDGLFIWLTAGDGRRSVFFPPHPIPRSRLVVIPTVSPILAPSRYTTHMARYVCCVAQHDPDSGNSSLNASREDLLMAMNSSDQSDIPPSFDSVCAHEACPSCSPPGSPFTTRRSPLPPTSPKSTISLPGYSASLPVPDYHPNPTGSEQRLEFVPSRSIYGRSAGVWTKRVKDMTINLHHQDPIEIQRAPRYGKGGNIIGTIEFDEENLVNFEKVKLLVRIPVTYGGVTHSD